MLASVGGHGGERLVDEQDAGAAVAHGVFVLRGLQRMLSGTITAPAQPAAR